MKPFLTSLAALLFTCVLVPRASSELAPFQDPPWRGYFAVFNVARTQLCVSGQGAISVARATNKSELSPLAALPVQIFVEETQPDGNKVERPLDPAAMESSQDPAENPDQLVIKGKAEGGILVEILIEQTRGEIHVGGRVLDPGSRGHNPLRLAIRIPFPTSHVKPEPSIDKQESKQESKREAKREARESGKAFDKSVARDSIRLKRTDGKLQKLSLDKHLNAIPEYFSGPGMAEVEIETGFCGGAGLLLSASPNSSLSFATGADIPLYQGFTLVWRADTAKDPETHARLGLRMK